MRDGPAALLRGLEVGGEGIGDRVRRLVEKEVPMRVKGPEIVGGELGRSIVRASYPDRREQEPEGRRGRC